MIKGPWVEAIDGIQRGLKRPFTDIPEHVHNGGEGWSEKEWGHKATPNILELQSAIAEAARICGKPRGRHTHKLASDHRAQVALEDAISRRSLEPNHIARFILQRTVFRRRRNVKALTGIAQAAFFLNNPRTPGRKTTGKQLIRGLQSPDPGDATSFAAAHSATVLTQSYGILIKSTQTPKKSPSRLRREPHLVQG